MLKSLQKIVAKAKGNSLRSCLNGPTGLPSDPLTTRLNVLCSDDLKTILRSGLKVDEEIVYGKNKDALIRLFSKELRAAASSTTASLFREDHQFPYKQILIDVADKLTDGHTPLSWTKFKLDDAHTELEIEEAIATLFEEKARKWWSKLSAEEKSKFSNDILTALNNEGVGAAASGGLKDFAVQQMIELLIQEGITRGIGLVAAKGVFGTVGVSVVGQLGWMILLQTVGWMGGVKIFLFGLGGYGALGGAVGAVGATALGTAMSIPTLFAMVDGTAYRKTVPSVIMLISRLRAPRNVG